MSACGNVRTNMHLICRFHVVSFFVSSCILNGV
jgi:hypothetical protein